MKPSLTSTQKNAFKRPEQSDRNSLSTHIYCLFRKHIYHVSRKLLNLSESTRCYKRKLNLEADQGWFHNFLLFFTLDYGWSEINLNWNICSTDKTSCVQFNSLMFSICKTYWNRFVLTLEGYKSAKPISAQCHTWFFDVFNIQNLLK